MSPSSPVDQPLFSRPVLWAIRLLSLLALAVSGYLAYTSLGHSTVAGCSGAGAVDCEAVLGTEWSRWLGLPVAVGGLACYSSLFALSLLAGWPQLRTTKWVPTLILMLAIVAAGAGLWFASLQFLVVHKVCLYCMGVHLTGITIAVLVVWSMLRNRHTQPSASRPVSSLAATLPASSASRVPAAAPQQTAGPSWAWALGGAGAVLLLLIGGQLYAPADTYQISDSVTLDEAIDMSGEPGITEVAQSTPPDATKAHVVHRMPTDDVAKAEEPPAEPKPIIDDPAAEPMVKQEEPQVVDPNIVPTAAIAEAASTEGVVTALASVEPAPAIEKTQKIEPAEPAPVQEKARPERKVTFLNGSLTIDTYDNAILGSPDAPYVIVELMDYMCPHCRHEHEVIKRVQRKYGDKLAIVVMPVPLETGCNRYMQRTTPGHQGACKLASLSLAVWSIRPSAFPRYHDWLLADEKKPPSVNKAIIQAFDLVDGKQLRTLSEGGEIDARINRDVELYVKLSKKQSGLGLPVQIVGDKILTGKVSADKLSRTWEKELGIEPE